jgi:hypothetical protein
MIGIPRCGWIWSMPAGRDHDNLPINAALMARLDRGLARAGGAGQ